MPRSFRKRMLFRGGARRLAACLFALLLGAAFSPAAFSQAPIQVRSEIVNLDVVVTDARGKFVRGLKKANFRVLDEGNEQEISHFSPIEAPAAVLVLVEASPAVYLLHGQHIQAVYALLAGLAPDDQVALASYDQSTRLLLPFTADKRTLLGALGGLRYNLGVSELRLYDAVREALAWLAPVPGKKALVLLSTGLDTTSQPQWPTLVEKLRSSEVVVYAVALGGELREYAGTTENANPQEGLENPRLSFQEANRVLREVAEVSGGQVYFPKKADEFTGIYQQIAQMLRHRYSLGFVPRARDGKYHRLFVQLVDDGGRILGPHYAELAPGKKPRGKGGVSQGRIRYRLFFRRGYVAPGP